MEYITFLNTPVNFKRLLTIYSVDELIDWSTQKQNEQYTIIGSGSNILFQNDYNGTILKSNICSEPKILTQNKNTVRIEFASGYDWHQCVLYCAKNNYYGIENLSYIPGLVGSAIVQNIGAYGVELKDCQPTVKAFDMSSHKIVYFDTSQMQFAYRDSVFKKQLDRYFIISISINLSTLKKFTLDYPDLHQLKKIKNLSLLEVVEFVKAVRKKKLPDPKINPNLGSFFTNPIIDNDTLQKIKIILPNIPFYLTNKGIKIPAAYLIEKAGLKGYKHPNGACVSEQHSLVIINPNNVSGTKIMELANHIKKAVYKKFAIQLKEEVRIYD